MAKFLQAVQPLLIMLSLLSLGSADMTSDRAECAEKLVGLSTCLPYVQGKGKSPTPDCCSGLKEVLSKSPKCLCVLIKDSDDPNLGIKIDKSLALSLPSACDAKADVTKCPQLLNIPPNSPDAKVFMQPGKAAQVNATSSSVKGNSTDNAHESSGGRSNYVRRISWLRGQLVVEFLLLLLLPIVVFT